jgi:hypothetical protein
MNVLVALKDPNPCLSEILDHKTWRFTLVRDPILTDLDESEKQFLP